MTISPVIIQLGGFEGSPSTGNRWGPGLQSTAGISEKTKSLPTMASWQPQCTIFHEVTDHSQVLLCHISLKACDHFSSKIGIPTTVGLGKPPWSAPISNTSSRPWPWLILPCKICTFAGQKEDVFFSFVAHITHKYIYIWTSTTCWLLGSAVPVVTPQGSKHAHRKGWFIMIEKPPNHSDE